MNFLRLPLALVLAVLSPGFSAYEACASGLKSGSVAGVVGAGPVVTIPQITIPSLASGAALPVTAAVGHAALPPVRIGAPIVPAAAAADGSVPMQALPSLEQAVQNIERDGEPSAQPLDQLFEGRRAAASSPVDPGSDAARAAAALSAAQALAKFEVSGVKAVALDQSKPREERSAAVKALAKRGDVAAANALYHVGLDDPSTDADDYEVKREALRALARFGPVVSLPPISRAHADEILKGLAGAKKPEAAGLDFDATLEPSGSSMSEATHAALKALAKSGVETMIVTARAQDGRPGDRADVGMFSVTTADDSADYTVATNRGAQVFGQYNGWFDAVPAAPKWTQDELEALGWASGELVRALEGKGVVEGDQTWSSGYEFRHYLPKNFSDEDVDSAMWRISGTLALKPGGLGARVSARYARGEFPPYLVVSKYDKSLAIKTLRAKRDYFIRHRDFWRKAWRLRGLAKLLPGGASVPAQSVLLVGDHFFGANAIDSDMIKGAPGALAISVGGTADPRLENIFVWPTRGHEASMEIVKAASGPAPAQMEGLNKKAAFGLFTSRSLSIVAFLATTLAHASLSLQVLKGDLSAFGTLGALGALAAIAAGPLMGRVADTLSPRKGMTINLVMRGVFLLDLPVFAAFGMLNFWTLMLGSIANGFLLSSIMTSEGTYLRRLFGFKNLGTMNALLQLNYFTLQIVFGLMLGIGKLVDGHSLMIPFYIGSAVNFGLIPLIRATMPNTTAAQEAGLAPAAKPGVSLRRRLADFRALPKMVRKESYAQARRWTRRALASARGFIRRDWMQATLLVAAIASFPLLHSALPISAALLFWITRTQGFAAIKADKPILKAISLLFLGGFMLYSTQAFLLPMMAKTLAGGGFSELLGKMLGSLFLGQMISSSSLAKLPIVRAPFIGRFGLQRLIQLGVLGLVGIWVFTSLIPGSILGAAAAVALATGMMAGAGRMTDRGWLSAVGVGLASLALPAMFWPNTVFLLAGLVSLGFFLGPTSANLFAYVQRRAPPQKMGAIFGIQSGLFNAAISLGIGSISLLTSVFSPAFPASLWAMAALGAFVGGLYFLISRTMPGLSKGFFKNKEKK